MKRNFLNLLMMTALAISMSVFFAACADDDDDDDVAADAAGSGTLIFVTNGEEFIRDGFVAVDGWDISFDHFYVNLYGPTAFQVAETEDETEAAEKLARLAPQHAGHDHSEIDDGEAHESLLGDYFVDLAQGSEAAELGRIEGVAVGNYNYLNFTIRPATADSAGLVAGYEGYSIIMVGQATTDTTVVDFEIKLTEELPFIDCGPVADYAGVVEDGGEATVELTFHSDHVFGDQETIGEEDSVNDIAVGFGPFAELAVDGTADLTQDDLQTGMEAAIYQKLIEAFETLGHTGEAHCYLSED
jgi:hypothetical protein